jgi:hypothetical protein
MDKDAGYRTFVSPYASISIASPDPHLPLLSLTPTGSRSLGMPSCATLLASRVSRLARAQAVPEVRSIQTYQKKSFQIPEFTKVDHKK